MKSILLFILSLSIAVQSASVLPADRSSSSSVHVKQGDNEYSYSIHESREVQQSESSPETKQIPQQIIANTLQSEISQISGEARDPKIQDQEKNREQRGVDGSNISDSREVKGIEYKEVDDQPRQGLNILVPIENQPQGDS
ncbi:uncharacterized protein [Leptinotarsa decemlineata]|uniref:uncharacterized protein n=1 Tax=Leptinotarsa decemlineata TaxID=7539 RepID=UPI003D30C934